MRLKPWFYLALAGIALYQLKKNEPAAYRRVQGLGDAARTGLGKALDRLAEIFDHQAGKLNRETGSGPRG